jgi:hypothetical protein
MAEYLQSGVVGRHPAHARQSEPGACVVRSWLNPSRIADFNDRSDTGSIAHSILLEGSRIASASSTRTTTRPRRPATSPTGGRTSIRTARDAARCEGKIPVLRRTWSQSTQHGRLRAGVHRAACAPPSRRSGPRSSRTAASPSSRCYGTRPARCAACAPTASARIGPSSSTRSSARSASRTPSAARMAHHGLRHFRRVLSPRRALVSPRRARERRPADRARRRHRARQDVHRDAPREPASPATSRSR